MTRWVKLLVLAEAVLLGFAVGATAQQRDEFVEYTGPFPLPNELMSTFAFRSIAGVQFPNPGETKFFFTDTKRAHLENGRWNPHMVALVPGIVAPNA